MITKARFPRSRNFVSSLVENVKDFSWNLLLPLSRILQGENLLHLSPLSANNFAWISLSGISLITNCVMQQTSHTLSLHSVPHPLHNLGAPKLERSLTLVSLAFLEKESKGNHQKGRKARETSKKQGFYRTSFLRRALKSLEKKGETHKNVRGETHKNAMKSSQWKKQGDPKQRGLEGQRGSVTLSYCLSAGFFSVAVLSRYALEFGAKRNQ